MLGQQRPQRNNEKPNGKTTTAITPGHHRAPHEAEFKSQPPLPSADSVRLGLAFSPKVPCTQNMRF